MSTSRRERRSKGIGLKKYSHSMLLNLGWKRGICTQLGHKRRFACTNLYVGVGGGLVQRQEHAPERSRRCECYKAFQKATVGRIRDDMDILSKR